MLSLAELYQRVIMYSIYQNRRSVFFYLLFWYVIRLMTWQHCRLWEFIIKLNRMFYTLQDYYLYHRSMLELSPILHKQYEIHPTDRFDYYLIVQWNWIGSYFLVQWTAEVGFLHESNTIAWIKLSKYHS